VHRRRLLRRNAMPRDGPHGARRHGVLHPQASRVHSPGALLRAGGPPKVLPLRAVLLRRLRRDRRCGICVRLADPCARDTAQEGPQAQPAIRRRILDHIAEGNQRNMNKCRDISLSKPPDSTFPLATGKGDPKAIPSRRRFHRLPSASGGSLGAGGGWESRNCCPVYILVSSFLGLCMLGLGLGCPTPVMRCWMFFLYCFVSGERRRGCRDIPGGFPACAGGDGTRIFYPLCELGLNVFPVASSMYLLVTSVSVVDGVW
jgi:hypothetical protein